MSKKVIIGGVAAAVSVLTLIYSVHVPKRAPRKLAFADRVYTLAWDYGGSPQPVQIVGHNLYWGFFWTDPITGGRAAKLSNLVDVGNVWQTSLTIPWSQDNDAIPEAAIMVTAVHTDGTEDGSTNVLQVFASTTPAPTATPVMSPSPTSPTPTTTPTVVPTLTPSPSLTPTPSSPTASPTATPTASPSLTQPTGLIAIVTNIQVRWNYSGTNEQGFLIERSTDGINFVQVKTVGSGGRSWNDNHVVPQTTYYYRVRAFNVFGVSGYSNVVSATTATR